MRSSLIGGQPIIRCAVSLGIVGRQGPFAFHIEALERHEDFVTEREQLAPEVRGFDAPVAQLRHRRAERIGELGG
jgi:hypothetical protein